MSVVPMMFRDWWDEWETPMRSSRLLDQHFGSGLRRDDISSFTNTPSLLRSGYIRPWRNTSLQRQDSGSVLNCEKDKFQVILDVQQFIPNEITVKTTDKFIIVEGKHEEKQDEHGFVSRHFQRRYMLPRKFNLINFNNFVNKKCIFLLGDINPNDITSALSSDGVLTITAPKKSVPPPETERTVPIQQTGPSSKETQPKIDHVI